VEFGSEPTPIGTREQVLRTALELFRTQGYDGTSLRQIADRLGMTKAALYYHFPAKENLIVELTRPMLDDLAELLSEAKTNPARSRAHDRVSLLAAYLDLFIRHHEVVSLLARDTGTLQHPDVAQRARALIEALHTALTGPEGTEEERLRVGCAIGALNSIANLPAEQVSRSRETVLDAALATLQAPSASRQHKQGKG
jgi:AcrR family transcriptional regulator